MAIKRLVAEEIQLEEEKTITYPKGFKYVYFKDPETGKLYDPNTGFEVTGENLENLFHEVG